MKEKFLFTMSEDVHEKTLDYITKKRKNIYEEKKSFGYSQILI
jgi:hypothetical protein